jgi:hypothetical protein
MMKHDKKPEKLERLIALLIAGALIASSAEANPITSSEQEDLAATIAAENIADKTGEDLSPSFKATLLEHYKAKHSLELNLKQHVRALEVKGSTYVFVEHGRDMYVHRLNPQGEVAHAPIHPTLKSSYLSAKDAKAVSSGYLHADTKEATASMPDHIRRRLEASDDKAAFLDPKTGQWVVYGLNERGDRVITRATKTPGPTRPGKPSSKQPTTTATASSRGAPSPMPSTSPYLDQSVRYRFDGTNWHQRSEVLSEATKKNLRAAKGDPVLQNAEAFNNPSPSSISTYGEKLAGPVGQGKYKPDASLWDLFATTTGLVNTNEKNAEIRARYNRWLLDKYNVYLQEAKDLHEQYKQIPKELAANASKIRNELKNLSREENSPLERNIILPGRDRIMEAKRGKSTKSSEEQFYAAFSSGGGDLGLENNQLGKVREAWKDMRTTPPGSPIYNVYPENMSVDQAKKYLEFRKQGSSKGEAQLKAGIPSVYASSPGSGVDLRRDKDNSRALVPYQGSSTRSDAPRWGSSPVDSPAIRDGNERALVTRQPSSRASDRPDTSRSEDPNARGLVPYKWGSSTADSRVARDPNERALVTPQPSSRASDRPDTSRSEDPNARGLVPYKWGSTPADSRAARDANDRALVPYKWSSKASDRPGVSRADGRVVRNANERALAPYQWSSRASDKPGVSRADSRAMRNANERALAPYQPTSRASDRPGAWHGPHQESMRPGMSTMRDRPAAWQGPQPQSPVPGTSTMRDRPAAWQGPQPQSQVPGTSTMRDRPADWQGPQPQSEKGRQYGPDPMYGPKDKPRAYGPDPMYGPKEKQGGSQTTGPSSVFGKVKSWWNNLMSRRAANELEERHKRKVKRLHG